MVSNSMERKVGIALQYVQMALNIIIQLIYTPIMIGILGNNEYGIFSIATSTIAYLSLLSLGFGAFYIRYYSIYKSEGKEEKINKLNGLYIIVFSIMGLVVLVIGTIVAINANVFFNESYSESDITTAKILMFILSINLAWSFPASVFTSYITSQEKFIVQKLVNMVRTIVGPIVNIILLYYGFGSIGMVIATTLFSVMVDCFNIWYCLKKLKMNISFGKIDVPLLKDIAVFSSFIAMNQVIDQINWQTDKIILGKMINGVSVAVYTIGAQINTLFTQFSTSISSVFAPKVNAIVSKKESNMDYQLTELLIRVGRMQWYVMALVLSGFIFFGQYFILIWVGEGYENAYWVALLLMTPATVPLIQNIAIEVQRAKNKHQVRSIAYLIMSLINIGISIWFTSMWGEIGAALGTTISIVACPILFLNIYYHLRMGLDMKKYWASIIKTLPAFIVPIAAGILMMRFYSFSSLIDFCIFIMAYVIIYLLNIYFLAFNKEEKELAGRIVKKFMHKTEHK